LLLKEIPLAGAISELLSWKTYMFVQSSALLTSFIMYLLFICRYRLKIDWVMLDETVWSIAVVEVSMEEEQLLRVRPDSNDLFCDEVYMVWLPSE